jgi:hypothetical protein
VDAKCSNRIVGIVAGYDIEHSSGVFDGACDGPDLILRRTDWNNSAPADESPRWP